MDKNHELFEQAPIPRAVAAMAIPTIISMIVAMVYNIADTFFIGQTGNALMVSAVSLTSPIFTIFTAFGNLFGIGGSTAISRYHSAKILGRLPFIQENPASPTRATVLAFRKSNARIMQNVSLIYPTIMSMLIMKIRDSADISVTAPIFKDCFGILKRVKLKPLPVTS